jgi:4-aminobutyrate aminotransferase
MTTTSPGSVARRLAAPSAAPPPPSEGDDNRSARRAAWQARHLAPETRAVLEADARVFLHQSLSSPCLNALSGASGTQIVDLEGRTLLDFHANQVNVVGFANPRVLEAVRTQMDALVFCTRRYTNEPAIRLAERLVTLSGGVLSRVLFTTSGATAMSAAVQLARVATGRHKTVSFWDSFHGATLDTISLGGEVDFRAGIGPLLAGTEHVLPPDPSRCPLGCRARSGGCDLACAAYLEYVLEHEGDVAAVVAETIRSTPVIPPPGYWRRIREACDRHGALLILDEIPNGLGRTGHVFSFEAEGITPDIVVLGKSLGGGVMPIAALLAREELNVASHRAIGHFTFEKSPLAAAAALAVLDIIEEEGLSARARELGAATMARLAGLALRHPLVQGVRGRGLLMGLELHRSPGDDIAEAVGYAALTRGLNAKPTLGHVLQLAPALTITEAELERAVSMLDASLDEVEAELLGAEGTFWHG